METTNAAELLAALGHESRLAIFRLLVEAGPEGMIVSTIAEKLGIPGATLSFHLSHLSRAGLIKGERESRFIRYSVEYLTMDDLIAFLTSNCCGGATCLQKTAPCDTTAKRRNHLSNQSEEKTTMNERIFNVLFLCTGNSARSILAESLLNHLGKGRFRAFSAGSHPAGQVNPFVLELLKKQGMPADGLRSKSWDEFSAPGAPALDFVFTVCDNAAGEVCPIWPGQPMTAHWGIEDPANVDGDDQSKREAMSSAHRLLAHRISLFTSLPFEKLDRLSLQKRLEGIGHAQG